MTAGHGSDAGARSEVTTLPGVTETAALHAALHACRSLLSIEGPEDAAEIARRLVADLGGRVVDAHTSGSPGVPVDVSFGHGSPGLPFAPVGSPTRALLETYLPGFVRDAHRALELVDRPARLIEDASIDALTGVHNKRAIGRVLGRLRDDDTVVMLDLDHFKSVNDTLGHLVGDEVLRAFGAALRATARATDRVGRYGGEEFVVVLASTEPEPFLKRLRQEWESLRPHPVTFSGGYTGPNVPPTQALNAADRALYRAKGLGRDRWERTIEDDLL